MSIKNSPLHKLSVWTITQTQTVRSSSSYWRHNCGVYRDRESSKVGTVWVDVIEIDIQSAKGRFGCFLGQVEFAVLQRRFRTAKTT